MASLAFALPGARALGLFPQALGLASAYFLYARLSFGTRHFGRILFPFLLSTLSRTIYLLLISLTSSLF